MAIVCFRRILVPRRARRIINFGKKYSQWPNQQPQLCDSFTCENTRLLAPPRPTDWIETYSYELIYIDAYLNNIPWRLFRPVVPDWLLHRSNDLCEFFSFNIPICVFKLNSNAEFFFAGVYITKVHVRMWSPVSALCAARRMDPAQVTCKGCGFVGVGSWLL